MTARQADRTRCNRARWASFRVLALGCALAIMLGTTPSAAQESAFPETGDELAAARFVHRVLPILKKKCLACHGDEPDDLRGALDLGSREAWLAGGESGQPAIDLEQPAASLVLEAVRWEGLEMPPKENDRLQAREIAELEAWVAAGAPWPTAEDQRRLQQGDLGRWPDDAGVLVSTSGGLDGLWTQRRYDPLDLWAYQPLRPPAAGSMPTERHPVDALIDRALEQQGLTPLPRASRATRLRRLSYDLTGLPPTLAELEAFETDDRPDAWRRQVERLLASPQFGEQWARHWLDVVRYADSSGFSNDFARPNAWRYRDYVIRAFNDDKPYDRFVQEQIAGDELFPDDPESLIAVGYLRMGPWEHTSMSVEAVTRQHFLDDVTNSVGVTFLAHELRCASCHDHKFDPIPTRDYYRLQAIFASTQFADRRVPFLDQENTDRMEQGRQRIQALQAVEGVRSLRTVDRSRWPVAEWDQESEDKGHVKVNQKREQYLKRELKSFQPLAFSVYSGADRPFVSNKVYAYMPPAEQLLGEVQPVHILTGGSLESPADPVQPGALSVIELGGVAMDVPTAIQGRRAALARWLTDPRHPLTARVIANRVWQAHFGKGLAANPNNFGVNGGKPSHPELLDFLAQYLIDHDWSLKALHRLILTSETWQRASGPVSDEVRQRDPDNRLYSHFSSRRLTAEELRDSMLRVSGELNLEMGGLPIRPEINREIAMQPRHIMGSVAPAYQPSPDPQQRNRRTIYAERIRTLRDPMLEVFNQPGTDVSCERRDASTITPQAFTLLNSQNSHDRALAWAARLVSAAPQGPPESWITSAWEDAYGRQPTPVELAACRGHFEKMVRHHTEVAPQTAQVPTTVIREMVEEMTGLTFYWVEDLDIYAGPYQADLKPGDVDPATRALAEITLVLLNSNEFVTVD